MSSFPVGSQLTLKAVFRNADGVAVSPPSVTVDLISPAGVPTSFTCPGDSELTTTATGHFEFRYVLATAGTWYVRWSGDESVIAYSRDIPIVIAASRFT